MGRVLSLIYGLVCWIGFLAVFLYMVGFLGNFGVPKTINEGPETATATALMINLCLIALFGIHHSVTARPWFKEMITKHTPTHLERSTYVLISNILIAAIMWGWRPMPGLIWEVENETARVLIYSIYGLAWGLIVLSSFLINHFDLFGVRQVFLHFQGKEYTAVPFKARSLYKHIRNPLMLGWFVAFWFTPLMTVGHLVFALGMTAYGLIGIYFEERTHAKYLGEEYQQYRDKTPMILPFTKLKKNP